MAQAPEEARDVARAPQGARRGVRVLVFALSLFSLWVFSKYRDNQSGAVGPYSAAFALFLLAHGILCLGTLTWLVSPERAEASVRRLTKVLAVLWKRQDDRRIHGVTVATLVAVHVATVALMAPRRIWSLSRPFLAGDYGHHLHQVDAVTSFLRSGSGWAGYDPYFMAGYPEGSVFDVDMKWSEGLAYVLGLFHVPIATALNYDIVFKFVCGPFLALLTALVYRFPPRRRLIALGLALLLWYSSWWFRNFNINGMYNFVFASCLAPLTIACASRWMEGGRPFALALLTLGVAVLLGTHALGGVIVALPMLFVIFQAVRGGKWRRAGALCAALVLALAANLPWLIGMWRFLPFALKADGFFGRSLPSFLTSPVAFDSTMVLSLLALTMLARAPRSSDSSEAHDRQGALTLLVWTFFIGLFGYALPVLGEMEPRRFLISAGAASAVGVLFAIPDPVKAEGHAKGRFVVAVPAAAFMLFCLMKAAFTPLDPGADAACDKVGVLAAWIGTHAKHEKRRILFEDKSPDDFSPGAVAWHLKRELIGGPFSRTNLAQRFAGAATDTGEIFGVPLEKITSDDWENAIRAYNLGYVVARDALLLSSVERNPQLFHRIAELTLDGRPPNDNEPWQSKFNFVIFEVVGGEENRLIAGTAAVDADYNVIHVRGASKGSVVLPYHWLPGLHARPELPMARSEFWRDPVPFIEVTNGDVPDFDLVYSPTGLAR